ncbi:T9SS type A sorting domain-containing protein [Aequorivita sp. H23M31]|uniref:T9SS type A sorting domain-containing protein n=1 Tax=Aequorivita ciconiae TaxID=2494375 RepID=A0A410G1U5_9FLAO|nr:T9SS type A sorting domain-containing protein [Aequorivita sp. H23M31]QAA81209.1 T9SS type A sorting domain-containing protein [Aequorivita sp. H23M31]
MSEPYSIYSMYASKVADGIINPNESINVETLATGMYILKTQKGAVMKFVKE